MGRFIIPAAIILAVWIVYPTCYTVARSFFGQEGFGDFNGIDNYKSLFTSDILVKAIKNSAIWILVAPAVVTSIGLVFAVLTERIRWAVAFKTVVFMPMAISLFATGVIWHIGLLFYMLTNNVWTFFQSMWLNNKMDAEEAAEEARKVELKRTTAPAPGARTKDHRTKKQRKQGK